MSRYARARRIISVLTVMIYVVASLYSLLFAFSFIFSGVYGETARGLVLGVFMWLLFTALIALIGGALYAVLTGLRALFDLADHTLDLRTEGHERRSSPRQPQRSTAQAFTPISPEDQKILDDEYRQQQRFGKH